MSGGTSPFEGLRPLIGWLLDTNVTAEIISAGGYARVKGSIASLVTYQVSR
jgi:hypothetical protein